MNISLLAEQEYELLVDVLEESLSNLLIEIAETEQWGFRRDLLDRKLSLMKLLTKIEEMQVNTPSPEKQPVRLPQPPISDPVFQTNSSSHPVH